MTANRAPPPDPAGRPTGPGPSLDAYWRGRDARRSEARSRDRAAAALGLLASRGIAGGRLLDVGCGPGWALEAFAGAGFLATGIDGSPGAAEEARRRGLDARVLDLEALDGARLAAELGRFRAVVALEVLEHLRDPLSALRELGKLVEPGGRLVVSLPNEVHLAARLLVLVGRPPFGGHDDPHVRHFDLRRARRLLGAAGCVVEGTRYQGAAPPRWGALRALLGPLVPVLPGLLAISAVFLLQPGSPEDPRRPR